MTAQETTSFNQYVKPLVDHKKLIAIVAVATVGLGLLAGLAAPVSYASKASVLVYPVSNDPSDALGADESQVDMATEVRIATSQAVATAVSEKLAAQSISIAPDTVADSVTATSPKDSTVLDITFEAGTAAKAQAGADAYVDAYLEFRGDIANSGKASAEATINSRIEVLQDQLTEIEVRLAAAAPASAEQLVAAIEQTSVEGEIAAQQAALADLSTLTTETTRVIDRADRPDAPQGLSLVELLVGAVAGGLALGVVAAYVVAAVDGGNQPYNRRASDRQAPQLMDSLQTILAAVAGSLRSAPAGAEDGDPAAPAAQPVPVPVAVPVEAEPPVTVEPPAGPAPFELQPASAEIETQLEAIGTTGTVDPVDESDPEVDAEVGGPEPVEVGPQPLVAQPNTESLIETFQDLGAVAPVVGLSVGDEDARTSLVVAFDLADELHALGAKVLMIDVGLERPTFDTLLGLDLVPGLAEVLTGQTTLSDAVHPLSGLPGLDALTLGSVTEMTAAAMSGSQFERLMAEARMDYHSVLIIAGSVFDPIIPALATEADGIIVSTNLAPGESAGAELIERLATMPVPTLELISAVSTVQLAEDALVDTSEV